MHRVEDRPLASKADHAQLSFDSIASKPHGVHAGTHAWAGDEPPSDPKFHQRHIEPWLSALLQAEHVSLLIGNGFTTAVAVLAGASPVRMAPTPFPCDLADAVEAAARESASRCRRGNPNIEDQIRTARELITGLRILNHSSVESELATRTREHLAQWERALAARLTELIEEILSTERGIRAVLTSSDSPANHVRRIIGSFLLTFASRAATRERLHIFTTNYDRLIEYACDLLGLRLIDRFVGTLRPVFRASRLGIDIHYNPPGIRGEPRYLEGVVRFTKLHGSVDWRQENGLPGSPRIFRCALPFGEALSGANAADISRDGLIIYPNAAKDIETLDYPYAELFRDFAAAVCQPNAVLVTYGYGFGDDHVNRILRDMLTIPSTHLVIISYDGASGRIARFCEEAGRSEQITLLMGNHFGDLTTLVEHYLPKPAIDRTTWKMVELLNRRLPHADVKDTEDKGTGDVT